MEQRFAHPIESEFARLLERNGIAWEYEPHRFALTHGEFVPDFYLPEIGVYVEVTIARQRNVTRKNRKVREARERHGIIVNVLYRGDFERFALEHGVASEALRVDVDDDGEACSTHRGRGRGEQMRRARRHPARLRRLRDQLRAMAAAKA
jgi:hypothetical protein